MVILRLPMNMRSLVLLCVFVTSTLQSSVAARVPDNAFSKRQTASTGLLNDFQVYEPVLTPSGTSDQYGCVYTETLMEYDFAFSYGAPFVGSYTPPPCSFNRVTMNFTVTSRGVQFDRLGLMYLGDIEVFRTSTAEPTQNGQCDVVQSAGIGGYYRYHMDICKGDATSFAVVAESTEDNIRPWEFSEQPVHSTFFTIPDSPATADSILPISARLSASNEASAFSVPGQNASVSYTLPQNIKRAVVSLEACGQSAEEFWYTNVFSSEENTFENTAGSFYGYSPWREVQLLIDGQLAGVSWPFPIIFTGGIVPGFWRPIVGIDAFDLREHEIDVTPWLPLLCDGASHTFEIRVAGLNDDGAGHASISETVESYWVVTGKIFLFLDTVGSVTTGAQPTINLPPPSIAISSIITQNANGTINQTLSYNTAVTRSITISSIVKTSNGSSPVSWTQRLSYSNFNDITAQGFTQFTSQNTTGADASIPFAYANTYSYPISVTESFSESSSGALSINGSLTRGLDFNVFGPSIFPSGIQVFNVTSPAIFNLPGQLQPQSIQLPSSLPVFSGAMLSTTQVATAEYYSAPNGSYSFGTTTQDFSFSGAESGEPGVGYELYSRHVEAVNSSVVADTQSLAGQTFGVPTTAPAKGTAETGFTGFSIKAILGKGPGQTKAQLGGGPS